MSNGQKILCSDTLWHCTVSHRARQYEHEQYIQADDCICQICMNGIEDEQHVILRCDYYNDLFRYASQINTDLIGYDLRKLICHTNKL